MRATAVSSRLARCSDCAMSWYTLPEHSTSRRTCVALRVVLASSDRRCTHSKRPSVKSESGLIANGALSRPLGVITISGRRCSISAWRRSRWNSCAGRGGHRNAHAALGRAREPAHEACVGVLGAVALVAVRQQQRQAAGQPPLDEAAGDELVADDLRAVDEVAELRLPQHQRVRRLDRVAVLEARGTRARDSGELYTSSAPLAPGEVLDRRELLAGVGVVQHHVAVRERAALAVLAGQADVACPSSSSDAYASASAAPQSNVASGIVARFCSCLRELGVDREAVRHLQQLRAEAPHVGLGEARCRARCACRGRWCRRSARRAPRDRGRRVRARAPRAASRAPGSARRSAA